MTSQREEACFLLEVEAVRFEADRLTEEDLTCSSR